MAASSTRGLPTVQRKAGNTQDQWEAPLTKEILRQLKGTSKKENDVATKALMNAFVANMPSDGALKSLVDSGALLLISKHALRGLKSKRADEAGSCLRVCSQFAMLATQRPRLHVLREFLIDAIVHTEMIKVAACLAFQAPKWGLRGYALRVLVHLANAEELVPSLLEMIVEKPGPLTEPADSKPRVSSVKLISLIDAIVQCAKEAFDLGAVYHHQDVPIHSFVELGLRLLRTLAYCEAAAPSLLRAGLVQVCVPLLPNENPLNCSVVAGSCVANLSGRDASLAHHLKTLQHNRPWNIVPRVCLALAQSLVASEESWYLMDESAGSLVQLLYTVHSLSAVPECVVPLLQNKVLVSLETALRASCEAVVSATDSRVDRQVQVYVSQILLKLAGCSEGPTKMLAQASLVELVLASRRGRGINSAHVQANFTKLHRLLTRASLKESQSPPSRIALAFAGSVSESGQLKAALEKRGLSFTAVSMQVEESVSDTALPSELATLVESSALVLIAVSSAFVLSALARQFCNYVYITRKPMLGFANEACGSLDWLDVLLEDELLIDVSLGFDPLLNRAQELLKSEEDTEGLEEQEGFQGEMSSVALVRMFSHQITAGPPSQQDDMEEEKDDQDCKWDSVTQDQAARMLELYLQRMGPVGTEHVEKLGALKLKQLLVRQLDIEKTLAKLQMQKVDLTVESPLDISEAVGALLGHLQSSYLCSSPASWADLAEKLWPGDILLFQTKNLVSKMIRVVTGSKYDHVAVVQRRGRDGRVHLLQAFFDTGVVVTSLDHLRCSQPARYFERVMVRQVQPALPMILKRGLMKFSKSVQGSPYGINPIKLARRSTMALEQKESLGDKRTYFCSELIAAAWRYIGLIDSEKSSARYYPADFSSSASLVMAPGWSLGPEIPINLTSNG